MKCNFFKRAVGFMLASTMCFSNVGVNFPMLNSTKSPSAFADELQDYFKISGDIVFSAITGEIDWNQIVKPSTFDQPVKVKMTFESVDDAKETINIIYDSQYNSARDFCYMKIVHDGNGGGSFVIENVPKSVVQNGKTYIAKNYEVYAVPSLPYYSDNSSLSGSIDNTTSQVAGRVELSLVTQELTFSPKILPENITNNTDFTFNADFTNSYLDNLNLTQEIKANSVNGNTIDVPVGITWSVTQQAKEGYKFDNHYEIEYIPSNPDNDIPTNPNCIIEKGIDVTVKTINYAQNLKQSFFVEWIDNNNTKRPLLSEKNVILQYSSDDGNTWNSVSEENISKLGLTKLPVMSRTDSEKEQYEFSGLAAQDKDNNEIKYRVVVGENPENYVGEVNTNSDTQEQTIVFSERTEFKAEVIWNDTDYTDKRMDSDNFLNQLKFYRHIEGYGYEELELPVNALKKEDGKTWDISIPNLPRYDSQNNEYDYILVQGSIDSETVDINKNVIDGYKTYYDNGTGSHGNDIQMCHNGGSITEVLTDDTVFQAEKEWHDEPDDKKNRPESTVTLWRYISTAANNIDDAYEKGIAAQVVFQYKPTESSEPEDKIISYQLKNNNNTEILFNYMTVDNLPQTYSLPKYDDQGREYLYFVRESLTGKNADNYEIVYVDKDGNTYKNGVSSEGTIKNVRREKAAVSVSKLWKNPSGLSEINNAELQMRIFAKTNENSDYDELKVYSSEENSYAVLDENKKIAEQTVKNFSESLPYSEKMYYVNVYNSEGVRYDMSTAYILETVRQGTYSADENLNDSIITLQNGSTYAVQSLFKTNQILADGMNNYCYAVTNVITAKRNYNIIKQWHDSISDDDLEKVAYVKFNLERCSMKDIMSATSVYEHVDGSPFVVNSEDSREWNELIEELPKYDDEGYEYFYRAKEVRIIPKANESLDTSKWAVDYHYTPEQTRAVNYIPNGGDGYFTVNKTWQDNGDNLRKPVTIRVYKKQELLAELNNQKNSNGKQGSDIVDLSSITKRYECELTESNQYTYDVSYSNLKDPSDTANGRIEDYIVLEYYVGNPVTDGALMAEYTYDSLISAASTSGNYYFSGTAENNIRKYNVSTSVKNNQIFLMNTRTGYTSIKVGKQWRDNQNSSNNRPVSIKFQLFQDGEKYKNIPDEVEIKGAELDRTEGIINVTGNAGSSWNFEISQLPMFSDSGIIRYYNVEEIQDTNSSSVGYISKKLNTSATDNGKTQNYTFNFCNTIYGTISHTAYKYWKDACVKDASERPDISFQLYRYLKKDADANPLTDVNKLSSYKVYIDYKNQIWSTEAEDKEHKFENSNISGYNWRITIDELPAFDENGDEYVYVFEEKINNDGVAVIGKYEQSSVKGKDGSDIFTNTLTGKMNVEGKKTWTGFAGYQSVSSEKDLPSPTILLYRTIDSAISKSLTEEQIDNYLESGKLEYIESTNLNNEKNSYIFKQHDKFDKDGNRYIYIVKESFDNVENKNIVDQLYTKTNSNGTLSNIFRNDTNRRSVTVSKEWDRSDLKYTQEKYPSVTYTLYRKLGDTSVEIESHTFSAEELYENEGKVSYTFKDLLIYSPKGEEYKYYITEKSINGYTIHYYDDDNIENSDRIDIKSQPKLDDKETNAEVKTVNVYDKRGKVQLNGQKKWDDYGNSENFRPEKITVHLKRHTLDENGQINAVSEVDVDLLDTVSSNEPYIEWDKTSDTNVWKYSIYNLERYAPNGMPYIYTLSEDKVAGYKQAKPVSKQIGNDDTVSMADMVNTYEGEFVIRKNWQDAYNQYNMRPDDVTVKLQRSTDGGKTWDDVTWNDNMTNKLPQAIDGVVSVNLNSNTMPEIVMNNTKQSSWTYTFKNLPTENSLHEKYIYRCVEVRIGGMALDDSGKAGAYVCSYTSQPASAENVQKAVIENTLHAASLKVTKEWIDDEDDMYQSRPDSLKFKLQKRPEYNGVPYSWEDVKKSDGTSYTFTISKKDNWTKELGDLPVAEIRNDLFVGDDTYYAYQLKFRAVEIHDSEELELVAGAKNYEDITVYDNAHEYKENAPQNEITISNKLICEPSQISVNKRWYRNPDKNEQAEFELKYRIKSDNSENKWESFKTPVKKTLSEDSLFTWKNLPKYDRDGNELEYKVVEKSIDDYKTVEGYDEASKSYTFKNIELQNYTVQKIWQNADYAHKTEEGFTAEFKLQKKVGNNDWKDTEEQNITLKSSNANDSTKEDTWKNLPKYDESNGDQIIYRAVEVKINGKPVTDNTNGDYIVTYEYDNHSSESAFNGTKTIATNRMVYGFVNLSKSGAYLAPAVTKTGNIKDAEFVIKDEDGNIYVSKIKTDGNGNIIRNPDGTYGDEHKYLITGTYTLEEVSANNSYSIWENGIKFTIGLDTTGEHGTAWIQTADADNGKGIKLAVEYLKNDGSHFYYDDCTSQVNDSTPAYNIESRGVIKFTKTGKNNTALDTHGDATGESDAYFGVYLDEICEHQVAGMSADDKEHFVLTNLDENGKEIYINEDEMPKNKDGIPYLREYNGGFSLLSGTYYIEEIVPPAGYVLDKTVRTVEIAKIEKIKNNIDISELYNSNIATIIGLTDNQWNNNPNTVKIYKRDQYGRAVQLKENGYLELTCFAGGTFKNVQNVIKLYQDSSHNDDYIKYENNAWTITGLLDSEKVYTLSEPAGSVPANNILAKPIEFKVTKEGNLEIEGVSQNNNLPDETSMEFENVYKSDASDNIIVMRDVSRYLKNVALEKKDSQTNKPIENISFMLFKKNGENVIKGNKILTTNSEGIIDLSKLDDDIINNETGYPLKFGLDIGEYYFEELEKGASDRYVIGEDIKFKIENNDGNNVVTYNDFAKVKFTTNEKVSQDENRHTGVVENDPVKDTKTLTISKIDINSGKSLTGAEFTLDYESITNGENGSLNTKSYRCTIGADGKLYSIKEDGTNVAVDISNKGTYTLKEVKAPSLHMTRTDDDGNPVIMATFKVDSKNKITELNYHSLVNPVSENEIDSELNLTVKNEETVVNISKLNDIVNGTKSKNQKNLNGETLSGAVLEIYNGDTLVCTLNDTNRVNGKWNLTGILSENIIYTLKETTTPVGYMKADDIYFKIDGTIVVDSEIQSQVYVWSGTDTPTLNGADWSTTDNLKRNVLTMVDEAIIAPVDMQKVVGGNTNFEILQGARFDVKVGDTPIGTAVSDGNGWLVWDDIVELGSVFDSNGTRVTDKSTVIGKTIILQQNESGYTFTETYAPSHAYNNGESRTVNITSARYLNYKDNSNGYKNNCYIDIQNGAWVTSRDKTATENDFVNPPYKSTVTLHKYDNDEEANRAAISNTEFTLYKGGSLYGKALSGGVVSENGKFYTDKDGNLEIEIREKGTYKLIETNAATGYVNSNAELSFTLDDADYSQTQQLKNEVDGVQDEYGVPNERLKGKVTFTKIDEKTKELLNDVEFTLTRDDTPANPENYLLKDSVTVKTGYNYRAEKNAAGNWILTETKSSDGVISIEGLNWGNYTLTESKELSGYLLGQKPLTYSFEVRANNLVIKNDKTNTKNSITLNKTNKPDSEANVDIIKGLAGAVFEIHEGEICSINCTKAEFYLSDNSTEKKTTVVSGADGKVTVYGLPTDNISDTPKTYHLVETKAPKGYKLQTEPTVFTIDRDGNVTSVGNTEVTMQDEAIKIYLKKTDKYGKGLDGAEFILTDICENCDNNHHLADWTDVTNVKDDITISVDSKNGSSTMIPIEKVIGGHKYKLKETKAPDGYECTAEMTFFVETDGTISNLEKAGQDKWFEISLSEDKKTITVADEIISSVLTKVDYADPNKVLDGVEFTLEPYRKDINDNTYSFSSGFNNDSRYDSSTGEFKFTTDSEGQFSIPDGLLKHDNKYLLRETKTINGYYLSKEAQDGVIIAVQKDGSFKIERLSPYDKLSLESCPVSATVDEQGKANVLLAFNMKSTSFELTKKVEGNMGDLNGEFQIKIEAYETYETENANKPVEIKIAEKTVMLKADEKYDSESGDKNKKNAFGALPVGAKIVISEDNDLDYTAVIKVADGEKELVEELDDNNKYEVQFKLLTNKKARIDLINTKNVAIDVGVNLEKQSIFAAITIFIPTAWLCFRYRRKRRKTGDFE